MLTARIRLATEFAGWRLCVFRIRRIHDDILPANQRAIENVKRLLRERFKTAPEHVVSGLSEHLRDPLKRQLRIVILVAETRRGVRGFAILMHAPDVRFCYLEYLAASQKDSSRGIGGALYERARDECRLLGVEGLFFECLPDDREDLSDPRKLKPNRARMRFYERFGARPIVGTAYRTKIGPNDSEKDLPYLMFDDLGSGKPLRRSRARAIVRAILERKYGWLCPPEYNARVVASFVNDPVVLRPFRYKTHAKPALKPKLRAPRDARIALIVNQRHEIHHVRERGYVEAPARIGAILKELNKLDVFQTLRPKRFPDTHVTAVHDRKFVRFLEAMCKGMRLGDTTYPSIFPVRNRARAPRDPEVHAGYYCIDTFTPLHRNAWYAARRAVDCALTGADALLSGTRMAYALVRPPGHHAEHNAFGGFCYLNTAAVSAHYLSKRGRVAILDVDYHHGNGQQNIFYEREDVLTVSIHRHPMFAYPYFSGFSDEKGEATGLGANINFPLGPSVNGVQYARVLKKALARVAAFDPRFLVVCLGLDTAKGDPTGTWLLRAKDFHHNGQLIGRMALPTLVVQEGGYNTRSLGAHGRHFFEGLWRGAADGGAL